MMKRALLGHRPYTMNMCTIDRPLLYVERMALFGVGPYQVQRRYAMTISEHDIVYELSGEVLGLYKNDLSRQVFKEFIRFDAS